MLDLRNIREGAALADWISRGGALLLGGFPVWVTLHEPLEGALRARLQQIVVWYLLSYQTEPLEGTVRARIQQSRSGHLLPAQTEPLEGAVRAR